MKSPIPLSRHIRFNYWNNRGLGSSKAKINQITTNQRENIMINVMVYGLLVFDYSSKSKTEIKMEIPFSSMSSHLKNFIGFIHI